MADIENELESVDYMDLFSEEDLSKYDKDLAQVDADLAEQNKHMPIEYVKHMWPVWEMKIKKEYYETLHLCVDDIMYRLEVQQNKCSKCSKRFFFGVGSDHHAHPVLFKRDTARPFNETNTVLRCYKCAHGLKKGAYV